MQNTEINHKIDPQRKPNLEKKLSFCNHEQIDPISIYKFVLSVCLSVCLNPINVKTAEPIRLKFFVGHHVTPGKVYGWSNFQKFASIKIRFLKILKIHNFFFENPQNFLFLLFVNKENRCVFYFEYKFLQIK